MGCCASVKVVPEQESMKEKQKIVVVLIGTSDSKQMINHCFKSLTEERAQHLVKQYPSSDVAFNYIRELDANTSVILIIAGHSYEKLKDEMAHMVPLPSKIRNLFVYSSENENREKPSTPATQYVYGKRHLLSAIHDVLVAFDAAPIYGPLAQYVSITIHQSTLNDLFDVIKSVQFPYFICTIKISRMKVVLSPSSFQFEAYAEVKALKILSRKQDVHGECELIMDENTKSFMIKVKTLFIDLSKIIGIGDIRDVGEYLPPFPLDGLINFAHPFNLHDMCETKRLVIIPRDLIVKVEEQRVTISVQIHYAGIAKQLK
jgi:nitrate reductase NapAB chaperone NapD